MSDPSHAMQALVYEALTGSAGVIAAMGGSARVHDKVLAEPTYPFIRIGDDESLGNDNSCANGWEFFVTIHIFARDADGAAARPTVKAIGSHARAALVEGITAIDPDGYELALAEFGSFRTYFESDGVTAHGVMTFRYLLSEDA